MYLFCILAVFCGGAMPLCELSPEGVTARLGALVQREPDFGARVQVLAKAGLGTPYADGPLGEGPEGKFDQDPLIDLSRVDCVTYVEQTVALATATTYEGAFAALQEIRYRGGVVNYEARNHFMVSDWLENNPWCEDVSRKLGVDTTPLTRRISRRGFFELVKAEGLGVDTPDRDVTIHCVPSALTAEASKKLPSPALIVFIGKIDWLFALHTGLFLRGEGEEGQLYHASSKAGEVVAVDLAGYVEENGGRYVGFTAYGFGFRVPGSGFRVSGREFKRYGLGAAEPQPKGLDGRD